MIPIHRILVPTDFSEPAHAALKWAVTLAREFDSRIFLLHVVPEPYAYPWGTELATMNLTEILAQSEEGARQRLAELAAETGLPAGRVLPNAVIGSPVDRILSLVKDEQIDLVVIGTHGRGLVGHLLLGSVAERVVRRSPVPVLTVHGDEAAAAGAQAAGASGVS